jgi:hypothetical protein
VILEIYRHLWGIEEELAAVMPKIKALGYAGVEVGLGQARSKKALRELMDEHGLKLIALVYTDGATVDEHLGSFQRQVEEARAFEATLVNSHSGRDGFSREESGRFFAEAARIERESGIEVAHETHRGRILFNPWVTERILNEHPGVKLCADFSHWVCVCERLLGGELDILRLAARRTLHVHARVGFEQGPQVSDPRAPEYARHLAAHEGWWDLIWEAQRERGSEVSYLTPEYGPPAYMPTMPFTGKPVANLWEICEWQAERERERFAAAMGLQRP